MPSVKKGKKASAKSKEKEKSSAVAATLAEKKVSPANQLSSEYDHVKANDIIPAEVKKSMGNLNRVADKLLHKFVTETTAGIDATVLSDIGNVAMEQCRSQFGILTKCMDVLAESDADDDDGKIGYIDGALKQIDNAALLLVEKLKSWGTTLVEFIVDHSIFSVCVLGGILLVRESMTNAVTPYFARKFRSKKHTSATATIGDITEVAREALWDLICGPLYVDLWKSFGDFVTMLLRPLFQLPVVGPLIESAIEFIVGVVTTIIRGITMRIASVASALFDKMLFVFLNVNRLAADMGVTGIRVEENPRVKETKPDVPDLSKLAINGKVKVTDQYTANVNLRVYPYDLLKSVALYPIMNHPELMLRVRTRDSSYSFTAPQFINWGKQWPDLHKRFNIPVAWNPSVGEVIPRMDGILYTHTPESFTACCEAFTLLAHHTKKIPWRFDIGDVRSTLHHDDNNVKHEYKIFNTYQTLEPCSSIKNPEFAQCLLSVAQQLRAQSLFSSQLWPLQLWATGVHKSGWLQWIILANAQTESNPSGLVLSVDKGVPEVIPYDIIFSPDKLSQTMNTPAVLQRTARLGSERAFRELAERANTPKLMTDAMEIIKNDGLHLLLREAYTFAPQTIKTQFSEFMLEISSI